MGLRSFSPLITSCPGCGRTTNTFYQKLALEMDNYIAERLPYWRENFPGVEDMKIAVMGCIVNGPGESRDANIGISLPGDLEKPIAEVFQDGKKLTMLRDEKTIIPEFQKLVEAYIEKNYSA